MEGLAKSPPSQVVSKPASPITQESLAPAMWNEVPMDIYKFMNIDFFDSSEKHQSELKDIYEYAKSRSNGLPGDMIQKIEELQNRLGEPSIGTSRLAQLTNYIRVVRNISDLNKQKKALERKVWN
jgi:hypothetical protein